MLALRADYDNGKITFIDALPANIKKARLAIVIEPNEEMERTSIPAQEFAIREKDSESEFKLIGLNSFFDDENDNNIKWEDYFGL